jgi:hypothetical protein
MIKGKYYFIILGLILIAALALRINSLFNNKNTDTNITSSPVSEQMESFVLEGNEKIENTATTSVTDTEPVAASLVVINQPQPNEVISSPLVVSGLARGNWFFEASLPIKITDKDGNILAVAAATAESDWMTTDLVPFKALLEFTSTSSDGYLIISKDNPSGIAEFDDSISIPLRFLIK